MRNKMENLRRSIKNLIMSNMVLYDLRSYFEPELIFTAPSTSGQATELELGRYLLKDPSDCNYTTEYQNRSRNIRYTKISLEIGDCVSSSWLSNEPNVLFHGMHHFAKVYLCEKLKLQPCGGVKTEDMVCKVRFLSGISLNDEKVSCLVSYLNWFCGYEEDYAKKLYIIDNLYFHMRNDVKNQTNNVDELYSRLFIAKVMNDPLELKPAPKLLIPFGKLV